MGNNVRGVSVSGILLGLYYIGMIGLVIDEKAEFIL